MCTILQTVDKGLVFIGAAQTAAEVEDGVIIIQREYAEEIFQFLEAFANLHGVAFVGFCVGLVELNQDGFTITVTGIKRV